MRDDCAAVVEAACVLFAGKYNISTSTYSLCQQVLSHLKSANKRSTSYILAFNNNNNNNSRTCSHAATLF